MYPQCPYCNSDTRKAGKNRYRCKNQECKKTFTHKDIDAIEDDIISDTPPAAQQEKAKKSTARPGPRNVRSKTTSIIGDGLAAGIMLATMQQDTRKNLTMAEAQSIGHPVIRIVGRRVPGWLKPLLPRTNINPDDLADLEEIGATFAKWAVRVISTSVEDFINKRGIEKVEAQQKQAVTHQPAQHRPAVAVPNASLDDLRHNKPTEIAPPPANGHNPAFDILPNIDLGVEV